MAMVDVDGSYQFLAESQPKLIGLVLGFGGHPALILHGGQKTGLFFLRVGNFATVRKSA